MSTDLQKVFDRVDLNRTLRKQADFTWGGLWKGTKNVGGKVVGRVLTPAMIGYDAYDQHKQFKRSGTGRAEDLHGFIGEDGYAHDIPHYGMSAAEGATYAIPFLGWTGIPERLLANFNHKERYRKPTDQYYQMRQNLADAGISVGRNGATSGFIGGQGMVQHRNPKWTKTQKQKLLDKMIDPDTGAPLEGWQRALDGLDYTTKTQRMGEINFLLGYLNKAKLAPQSIFSNVTGLATAESQAKTLDKFDYGRPAFNLRKSIENA